jgi:hypothetical protein
MESLMPQRVNSFGSAISGAIFILFAITIIFGEPAWAESLCIEQPPAATEVTPASVHHGYPACSSCHATPTEVLLWSFRYDRAKGRKCWFLSDTSGRDVTEEHVRGAGAAPPSIWSRLASVFDNFSFARASENTTSEALPSSSAELAHNRQANAINANRTDESVRTSKKTGGEGGATKQVSKVSLQPADQRLYQDFLRWREAQELIKTPDQRKELGLYEEFLRWSTRPDPSHSMQPVTGRAQL